MPRYKQPKLNTTSINTAPKRRVAVVIAGSYAGELCEHDHRALSFRYDEAYTGVDLSVAIPRNQGLDHYDAHVTPVIDGLLPDNKITRATMASKAGTVETDLIGLLACYGRDCPGAVQICEFEDLDDVLAAKGSYEPITESEIAERLVEAASETNPEWHGKNESWSLGGNQGKFALALIDGQWMRCTGAYPSTHIMKPGVTGMTSQALVEFLSMKIAAEIGLSVAEVEYQDFAGVSAVVVKRYDRAQSDGVVQRIHQEDFTQALGYLHDDKYDALTQECMRLIQTTATPQTAARFTNALFYNYLIGGIDAHAKNYSLLHSNVDKPSLAPLYDLASVLPYRKVTDEKWFKLPMSIGGQTKIGALTGSDIEKYAAKYNLDASACKGNMARMAERVPAAIEGIWERYAHVPHIDEVMEPLQRTVGQNCKAMLANIDRTHDSKSFVKPGLHIIKSGTLSRTDQAPALTQEEDKELTALQRAKKSLPKKTYVSHEDPIKTREQAKTSADAQNAKRSRKQEPKNPSR